MELAQKYQIIDAVSASNSKLINFLYEETKLDYQTVRKVLDVVYEGQNEVFKIAEIPPRTL